MSKLTYYFPFLIGLVLGPIVTYFRTAEWWAASSDGWRLAMAPYLLLAAGLWAVSLQLLMIGLQGVFAGVVPVYRGRSIRGTQAVVIGLLILIWEIAPLVGGLFILVFKIWSVALIWSLVIVSIVGLAGFIGTYLWCLPNAVRDFVDEPLKD